VPANRAEAALELVADGVRDHDDRDRPLRRLSRRG
jgi:hypothetical protein